MKWLKLTGEKKEFGKLEIGQRFYAPKTGGAYRKVAEQSGNARSLQGGFVIVFGPEEVVKLLEVE